MVGTLRGHVVVVVATLLCVGLAAVASVWSTLVAAVVAVVLMAVGLACVVSAEDRAVMNRYSLQVCYSYTGAACCYHAL
jgi:hypothetical protein